MKSAVEKLGYKGWVLNEQAGKTPVISLLGRQFSITVFYQNTSNSTT